MAFNRHYAKWTQISKLGKQNWKHSRLTKTVISIIFWNFYQNFSVEVARTFSTLLRFTEINDILHQTHNLYNKQLVGFDDLPSFLATEI